MMICTLRSCSELNVIQSRCAYWVLAEILVVFYRKRTGSLAAVRANSRRLKPAEEPNCS